MLYQTINGQAPIDTGAAAFRYNLAIAFNRVPLPATIVPVDDYLGECKEGALIRQHIDPRGREIAFVHLK